MRRLLVPVAVLVLLAGCSRSEPATPTVPSPTASLSAPSASPSTAPSPSPVPTVKPSPSSSPAVTGGEGQGGVVLGGASLGVTRIGAPFRQAVDRISAVLGTPTADPKKSVTCINAASEVQWGDFLIAERDGAVGGWSSTSRTLQTPSGVTVGTTVATLKQVYGQRLKLYPANPDGGPSFEVTGTSVGGVLSGSGSSATVTSLRTAFCAGP